MGFFEHVAAEQLEERNSSRKALVLARTRVDNTLGKFLRQASNSDEYAARVSLVSEDLDKIVSSATTEYAADSSTIRDSIIDHFRPAEMVARTASIQVEARKPKMCPYHSEVTAISLAQGEAQAGYNAMAQHAWSDKHCQGSDYDGGKCNFKPEMTTQSYWDDKTERAEERKQQRAEDAAQQTLDQPVDETPVEEFADAPDTEVPDSTDSVDSEPVDNVTEVDFGGDAGSGQEVPMAMAARFQEPRPAKVAADGMPEGIKALYDQLDAARERGDKKAVAEIEEALANRQAKVAADDGLGGQGVAEPKMDKRKWTPQNVKGLEDIDDANGRWPTKTVDPIEPIIDRYADDPDQIGENTTEHQSLPSSDNGGFNEKKLNGEQGGVFPNRNQTKPVSSKADDVNKNPIREIMESAEGFVPRSDIDAALDLL